MPSITLPPDGQNPYGTTLRTAINAINDQVDANTADIADGDATVAGFIDDVDSDTRAALVSATAALNDAGVAALVDDSGSLTSAALNSTYAANSRARVGLLGDSITDENELFTISGGYVTTPGAGYFYQANLHLREGMILIAEAGVSGERTDQILARVSEVEGCEIVVVLAGTNDIFANRTVLQITDGLTAIYDALTSMGVAVVAAGHITPSNDYTATQRGVQVAVNNWISNYAQAASRMVLIPWAAPITDATTGGYSTGMSYDGVHPTSTGAAFMGRVLADALRPYVGAEAALTTSNADPTNALTNGMMAGDSAGFATGYSNVSASSPVFTPRKRNRSDGVPGEWQEIDLTSGTVRLQCESAAAGTAWQVGDTVQALIELDTDDDLDAISTMELFLRGVTSGGGLVDQSAGLFNSFTSPRRTPVDRGVLATHPLLVTATMAKFQLRLQLAGEGVIRTSRWTIRKVA